MGKVSPYRRTDQRKPRGKLNILQDKGIAAILRCHTVTAAAKELGINRITLYDWLDNPAFASALEQARAEMLDGAISELREVARDAVHALKRNLKCGEPSVEVNAARVILDQLGVKPRITESAEGAGNTVKVEICFVQDRGPQGRIVDVESIDLEGGHDGTAN